LILFFNTPIKEFKTISTQINDLEDVDLYYQNLNLGSEEEIIFQGIESPLNITDYGKLIKQNQYISLTNQEDVNLSYYLDDDHNWEVSKIETSIKDIQDTRNWVNNSEFKSPIIFRKYQISHTNHPYPHPHNPNSVVDTITETGATYIRAHFTEIGFERFYDYFFLRDGSDNDHLITDTLNITDVYSPWIPGDTMKFTYDADSVGNYYGYHVDYYEFINASSNYDINSDTWGFNYVENGVSGTNIYGEGEFRNAIGMYVGLYGEYVAQEEHDYTAGAFSELYQNITIPRGQIKDAYLSFDYSVPFGLKSNDNYMYFKINNKKVYSKGMRDIIEVGKGIWQSTGKIYMDLWSNSSEIFEGDLNDQQFNISVGIMSGSSVSLTYFEESYQNILWFDNVSLVLTTMANSTQPDIDLRFDNTSLNEGNEWGSSTLNITKNYDSNPIILSVTTSSPSLTFSLNSTLYGYHNTISKINQQNDDGLTYRILENNTVYWEYYHNFYVPAEYSDLEFIINKPKEWDFIYVKDSTLQSIPFEMGKSGDAILKINETYAIFPGWWSFRASSPNYLNISNTKLFKQGEWVHNTSFNAGESTQIKTQLNHTNKIPTDAGVINLTIYHPNGTVFYKESKPPIAGTAIFSKITFGAFNTSGGLYEYTLLWSNGTSLGGLKSKFLVKHQSSLTLLKPDDAKLDLRSEGFVGDIIPVRVILRDSENNQTISNSIISYNWSDGTRYFTESALGIYETVMDTADLLTRGLHEIFIKSTKIGFFESNFTLEFNLGEKTNLQVLESEYNIELHDNSTIRFKFSGFGGVGIDGAIVNISIANESLYSLSNLGNGTYDIEFSTLFIENIGIHELSINFSAISFEPQFYIYQFQITEQSVDLLVSLNSQEWAENSVFKVVFNEELNISVKARSEIDNDYILGGDITCISGGYVKNLTGYGDYWYNTSIICSSDNFNFGINYIYLDFQDPNYKTATFGFQLLIEQIEVNVENVNFNDSINALVGETINIHLQLRDNNTQSLISNASVTYLWAYGNGIINETSDGNYQATIKLAGNILGNFKFEIRIIPEGSEYKGSTYSFLVVISKPISSEDEFPRLLLWIIIGILVSVASVLGVLSLRSYVFLPRRRRKEADLLAKTQKFKDVSNIQAIVIIHRLSGIPIYTRSYSILEKHKKEIFSGFIQAITTIGEEFTDKDNTELGSKDIKEAYAAEKFIELDFKYFYCLIADKEDIRTVIILRNKSSDRLKKQVSHFILALNLKLSREIENWDGSLDVFEDLVPNILNEYFELFYKDSFRLSENINLIKLRKDKNLSRMETRILNVIQSISERGNDINLNIVIELVSEENKDLVIEAIESLLERKLIIPTNS
jgi:hypothetical protein